LRFGVIIQLMKNLASFLTPVCLITAAFAYSPGAQEAAEANLPIAAFMQIDAATLSAGARIEAELTKAVDARKAKPGDQVASKVQNDVKQNGETVLHRGTKIIGHITQVQGKANGQAGFLLGIMFDRVELKSGQTLEIHAVIQDLAPPPPVNEDPGAGDVGRSGVFTPSRSEADDSLEGRTQNARAAGQADRAAIIGATAQPSEPTAGASTRATPATSRGVLGIPGLRIDDKLSNAANGTVLVSDHRNIHLDSGTRLVIRVTDGQPR
jgi:hypothetical protein